MAQIDRIAQAAFKKLFGLGSTEVKQFPLANESDATSITTTGRDVFTEAIPTTAGAISGRIVDCTNATPGTATSRLTLLRNPAEGAAEGCAYYVRVPASHGLIGLTNPYDGSTFALNDRVRTIISKKFDTSWRNILFNNVGAEITALDGSDWYVDERAGIVFFGTEPSPVPATLSCYVYIGKTLGSYNLDNVLTVSSSSPAAMLLDAGGSDGDPGPPGPPGAAGAAGSAGATGATGPQGPVGFGMDGDEGPEGFAIPGVAGAAGAAGATGPQGVPGINIPGIDGEDAWWGPTGVQGPTGATGSQGVAGQTAPGQDGDDATGSVLMGIPSGTIRTLGGVSGSGTLNTIPKWTPDGVTLGNSRLVDDNGTGVITSAASLVPQTDLFYDLGDTTRRWSGVYLSQLRSTGSLGLGTSDLSGSSFITRLSVSGAADVATIATEAVSSFTLGGIGSLPSTAPELRLSEPSASGSNYSALKAQAQAANITYTLPAVAPGTGQVLVAATGGTSSTLAWGSGSGSAMGPPGQDGEDGWPGPWGVPTGSGTVSGTGTPGNVVRWGSGPVLGNSIMLDDGATRVAVGGRLQILTGNPLRLYDSTDTRYAQFTQSIITGGADISYSLPATLPVRSGAALVSTTAGTLSWSNDAAAMGPPGQDGIDEDMGFPLFPWTPVLNVSGVDVSLPKGTIQSEVTAATAAGIRLFTKSDTGAQVLRLQLSAGQTVANTQLNFTNVSSVAFDGAVCTLLHNVTPQSDDTYSLGTSSLTWGLLRATSWCGGSPNNSTDMTMSCDNGGGTPVTVMTVLMGVAPQTATWAPNMAFTRSITTYNNVVTAGWGVPSIYKAGRVTAQTAANASISTYTVGAADGSFEVSANMNVTAATALATTLTCTYTDESNTARTMVLPVMQLSGSFIAAGAITGTGAWETPVIHIRCKASTAITIKTTAGTFTGCVYTAEGIIKQVS